MADVSVVFRGSINSSKPKNTLEVFANIQNRISITITDSFLVYPSVIELNKETAIKLHRELKKQISFLESEVNNG